MENAALWIVPLIIGVSLLFFASVFALITIFIVRVYKRNAAAARQAGMDPLAMETQMYGKVYNSQLLNQGLNPEATQGQRPMADRLEEVEGLYRTGAISAQERQSARDAILRDQ